MTTHYETLEVSEKASPEVIRGAFQQLKKKWMPRTSQEGKDPEANQRMAKINVAHDVLSDPERRKEYDEELRRERAAQQPPPPPPRPPPKPPPRPPPAPPPTAAGGGGPSSPNAPHGQAMELRPVRGIGSYVRLALAVTVSGWLGLNLLSSAPKIIATSRPAAVGGYHPPAGAACVLLETSGQRDMPNDAVISYKIKNKGNGEGPLKVRVELLTSRGKSVQEKEHRVEPGEEWKSFIAFSLAGTDAKFKFFVRCTP